MAWALGAWAGGDWGRGDRGTWGRGPTWAFGPASLKGFPAGAGGMKLDGVHHVRIPVPEDKMETMRTFYGHIGFRQVPPPPGRREAGAWFEGPNVKLLLGVTPEFRPLRDHPVLSLQVPDAEQVRKDLTARRRKVNDAPPIPGGKRFVAYDPAGNKLEFVELNTG